MRFHSFFCINCISLYSITFIFDTLHQLSPFNVLHVSPHGQREREKKAGQQTKTFHPRFVLREQ